MVVLCAFEQENMADSAFRSDGFDVLSNIMKSYDHARLQMHLVVRESC